jgi:hypothetical protein
MTGEAMIGPRPTTCDHHRPWRAPLAYKNEGTSGRKKRRMLFRWDFSADIGFENNDFRSMKRAALARFNVCRCLMERQLHSFRKRKLDLANGNPFG